ncbi:MAG: phage tail protein [Methylococcaceae bacterium]
MPNQQVLAGFYFSLAFVGQVGDMDAAFQEASGFSKELNVEEVVCGGQNRYKYRLPTTTTYQNLVLKRGVTLETSLLIDWCRYTLSTGLVLPIMTKNILISLLNKEGQSCKSWLFVDAYPVKWSVSELNSEKNAVLIETIELAYLYFEEIPFI